MFKLLKFFLLLFTSSFAFSSVSRQKEPTPEEVENFKRRIKKASVLVLGVDHSYPLDQARWEAYEQETGSIILGFSHCDPLWKTVGLELLDWRNKEEWLASLIAKLHEMRGNHQFDMVMFDRITFHHFMHFASSEDLPKTLHPLMKEGGRFLLGPLQSYIRGGKEIPFETVYEEPLRALARHQVDGFTLIKSGAPAYVECVDGLDFPYQPYTKTREAPVIADEDEDVLELVREPLYNGIVLFKGIFVGFAWLDPHPGVVRIDLLNIYDLENLQQTLDQRLLASDSPRRFRFILRGLCKAESVFSENDFRRISIGGSERIRDEQVFVTYIVKMPKKTS